MSAPVDFAVFPSGEQLAVNILKAAVTAGDFSPFTPHVGTKIPPDADYAKGVITVRRVGGVPTERHWIDHPNIQIDVWHDLKPKAERLSQIARVALMRAEGKVHTSPQCVLTGVEDAGGLAWDFDPTNLKPRYTVGVYLTLHP